MTIRGRCHCGAVSLALHWPDDARTVPARACGCGFCVKHGAVWTSNPSAALDVAVDPGAPPSRYAFGTRTATFHVCSRCGAVPLVTCEIGGRTRAVVNVNALEDLDPSRLHRTATAFEAEDVAGRLSRRERTWIGTVRFTGAEAG